MTIRKTAQLPSRARSNSARPPTPTRPEQNSSGHENPASAQDDQPNARRTDALPARPTSSSAHPGIATEPERKSSSGNKTSSIHDDSSSSRQTTRLSVTPASNSCEFQNVSQPERYSGGHAGSNELHESSSNARRLSAPNGYLDRLLRPCDESGSNQVPSRPGSSNGRARTPRQPSQKSASDEQPEAVQRDSGDIRLQSKQEIEGNKRPLSPITNSEADVLASTTSPPTNARPTHDVGEGYTFARHTLRSSKKQASTSKWRLSARTLSDEAGKLFESGQTRARATYERYRSASSAKSATTSSPLEKQAPISLSTDSRTASDPMLLTRRPRQMSQTGPGRVHSFEESTPPVSSYDDPLSARPLPSSSLSSPPMTLKIGTSISDGRRIQDVDGSEPPAVVTDGLLDARHLSPPGSSSSRAPSSFGLPSNSQPLSKEQKPSTFRTLHNVTPRPSSSDTENARLTGALDQSPGASFSSSPVPEPMQPEHYRSFPDAVLEEKIVVDSVDARVAFANPLGSTDCSHTRSESVPSITHSPPPAPLIAPFEPLVSSSSRSPRISDVSAIRDVPKTRVPYDVRDEVAPAAPFFSPSFQEAIKKGLAIVTDTVPVLEDIVTKSGNLERLLTDAKDLSAYEALNIRTAAILGNSGEGKSSLINALLDLPGIANTSDAGTACTSVVTEYRNKTRDHTAPITIEAEYLFDREIEELIPELLWRYRQPFVLDINHDTLDEKDLVRYERESEQAWSALQAAFSHESSFSADFLRDVSEGALKRITSQLIRWTRGITWPQGARAGRWFSTANTAGECCRMTGDFMTGRLWPFTKIIRVYVSAQVLKTGLILADLPGLQDTNLARVQATQKYLMKCDHVFIVANISRAITNQSLQSSLYEVLKRHVPVKWKESTMKGIQVAVVCTKSEEINERTARLEFCGQDNRILPAEMEQLDTNIQNAKDREDLLLAKELKRRQRIILMRARNEHVKAGLQDAYSAKAPNAKLDVFCVSSTAFEKHSVKGNDNMVQASGIPELRRFCHTITADAQLLESKHFLRSKLASLLSSLDIWVHSSPGQARVSNKSATEIVNATLKDARTKTFKTIEDSKSRFNATFKNGLALLIEHCCEGWKEAAKEKTTGWDKWHTVSYNAVCVNNGNHTTQKIGKVNWNQDFLEQMEKDLKKLWRIVKKEVPKSFQGILQAIHTVLKTMTEIVQEKGISCSLADSLSLRAQAIHYKFGLVEGKMARKIRNVRHQASEANESSYMLNNMLPTYRSAVLVKGKGRTANQIAIVRGRITDGLFDSILASIKKDMDDLIQTSFESLHDIVGGEFDLIKSDVDSATLGHDELEDEVDKTEQELKVKLVSEVDELKRRHEQVLRSIEEY